MKRSTATFTAIAAALAVAAVVAVPSFAHGPGWGGGGPGWGMGGYGQGPGMGGYGRGMMGGYGPGYGGQHHGPGWGMGGYGHGPGMMGYGYGPGAEGAPCADPAFADTRLKVVGERLNLTDAQKPAWEAFTKAVRENTESMQKMYESMDPEAFRAMSDEDRLAFMENRRADRLEAVGAVRDARDKLIDVLSDEQKSEARALLRGGFGRR